jgi:outer membrane protein TolC
VQLLPPAFYTAPNAAALPAADWWQRRLADPAARRLVEAALAYRARSCCRALARVEQARAGLRATAAERAPALEGSSSVTYNRTATEQFGFDTAGAPGPARARASIASGCFTGSASTRATIRPVRPAARRRTRRRARLDAAGFEAASVRLTLVTDVAANFVAARARRRGSGSRTRKSARRGDTVSVTRSRVRAGLVSGVDQRGPRGCSRNRGDAAADPGRAIVPDRRTGDADGLSAGRDRRPGRCRAEPAPLRPSHRRLPSDLLLRRPDVRRRLRRLRRRMPRPPPPSLPAIRG